VYTKLFQTTKGAQLTTDWFPSATYNCSLSSLLWWKSCLFYAFEHVFRRV